jgi:hypothetical protein
VKWPIMLIYRSFTITGVGLSEAWSCCLFSCKHMTDMALLSPNWGELNTIMLPAGWTDKFAASLSGLRMAMQARQRSCTLKKNI